MTKLRGNDLNWQLGIAAHFSTFSLANAQQRAHLSRAGLLKCYQLFIACFPSPVSSYGRHFYSAECRRVVVKSPRGLGTAQLKEYVFALGNDERVVVERILVIEPIP